MLSVDAVIVGVYFGGFHGQPVHRGETGARRQGRSGGPAAVSGREPFGKQFGQGTVAARPGAGAGLAGSGYTHTQRHGVPGGFIGPAEMTPVEPDLVCTSEGMSCNGSHGPCALVASFRLIRR